MGHYCHYQAMPENGSLLRCLATEPPLHALYEGLLHHPSGPFEAIKLSDQDRDSLLDDLVYRLGYESRAELDLVMARLRGELKRASGEAPGVESRSSYMKMTDDFEEAVIRGFSRQGHPDAGTIVDDLRYGVRPLASPSDSRSSCGLRLVPADVVATVVPWLSGVGADDFEEWPDEDFAPWRKMYLEAAERGEVILIGCG